MDGISPPGGLNRALLACFFVFINLSALKSASVTWKTFESWLAPAALLASASSCRHPEPECSGQCLSLTSFPRQLWAPVSTGSEVRGNSDRSSPEICLLKPVHSSRTLCISHSGKSSGLNERDTQSSFISPLTDKEKGGAQGSGHSLFLTGLLWWGRRSEKGTSNFFAFHRPEVLPSTFDDL